MMEDENLPEKPVLPLEAPPPAPDVQALERSARQQALNARILNLGKGICDNGVLMAAQRIAEPEFGGKSQNVFDAVPVIAGEVRRVFAEKRRQESGQTAAQEFGPPYSSPLDFDKSRMIENAELTAAMVAAARVAVKLGITNLHDLKPEHMDDIAKEAQPIHLKLKGEIKPSCGR